MIGRQEVGGDPAPPSRCRVGTARARLSGVRRARRPRRPGAPSSRRRPPTSACAGRSRTPRGAHRFSSTTNRFGPSSPPPGGSNRIRSSHQLRVRLEHPRRLAGAPCPRRAGRASAPRRHRRSGASPRARAAARTPSAPSGSRPRLRPTPSRTRSGRRSCPPRPRGARAAPRARARRRAGRASSREARRAVGASGRFRRR